MLYSSQIRDERKGKWTHYYFFTKIVPETGREREENVMNQRYENMTGRKKCDLYDRICLLLREIGVPAHLRGYAYLVEAVTLVLRQPEVLYHMTGELYPAVARKYNTTASGAERAMRHAVETAWLRGDPQILDFLFGNSIDPQRGKPANSEFIAQVSGALRQEVAA